MRVDDKLLRHAVVELGVALGRVVEADNLHVHGLGNLDFVVQDGLHQLAVVLHHRRLAGVEGVALGPAQAEADAQVAGFGGLVLARPDRRSRTGRGCRSCRPRGSLP